MNETGLVMRLLEEWRIAEVERRRLLLLEVGNIERRWGLGTFRDRGPEIMRLLDTSGTAEMGY